VRCQHRAVYSFVFIARSLCRRGSVLTRNPDQVARAHVVKNFKPGGDLNGAGRMSKSEQAGWSVAVDLGGRIAPERKIKEIAASKKLPAPKGTESLKSPRPADGCVVSTAWACHLPTGRAPGPCPARILASLVECMACKITPCHSIYAHVTENNLHCKAHCSCMNGLHRQMMPGDPSRQSP